MRAADAIDFCNNGRVRAVAFFVLLVACLAASWAGFSEPAHPAHDSWWPKQRAPRGFVTVRVRGVPAPVAASAAVPPVATVASPTAAPALTVDMREEMLSAAEKLDFEQAAALRDHLQKLQQKRTDLAKLGESTKIRPSSVAPGTKATRAKGKPGAPGTRPGKRGKPGR